MKKTMNKLSLRPHTSQMDTTDVLQWLHELQDVFDPPPARDYAQIARTVSRSNDGVPPGFDGISQNGRPRRGDQAVGEQVQREPVAISSAQQSRYLSRVLLNGCAMCGDEHCSVSQMFNGSTSPTLAKRHGAHVPRHHEKIAPKDRPFLRSVHALQRLRPATDGDSCLQALATGRQKFASYLKWISCRHSKNRRTLLEKKKAHKKVSGVRRRTRKTARRVQASTD